MSWWRFPFYPVHDGPFFMLQMYLAPEQISKLPHGTAVDMWAIGIVTFELLHGGVHPFW